MNAVATKPTGRKARAIAVTESVQEPEHPTITVVKTLADLVDRALIAHESSDLQAHETCMHGQTMVEMAIGRLRSVRSEPVHRDEPFFEIAALLAGALDHDRAKAPTAVGRHKLLQEAYDLAESATISYGCSEGPCVALANGIAAGRAVSAVHKVSERTSSQIDVEDLSGELIALNGLLDWMVQARDLCDEIRLSAEIDPELHAALKKNDIRFRSADWRGLDVGSGVAHVLSRQHTLILSIAGASK
jgi:hypothetical protein